MVSNSRDKNLYNKTKHTMTGWFNIHYKRLKQIDMNGNFIKEFVSISEAARQTSLTASCICECCQGKRKSTKGYRWKYV